jgi:hypothetical protein
MIGIRQKLRYTEILAARTILKDMIKENYPNKTNTDILNNILEDLDKIFLQQISFIENEIDLNYPAV